MQALVAAKGCRAWGKGYPSFGLVCRTDLSGIDALILDSVRRKETWVQLSGGDDSEEEWRVHCQSPSVEASSGNIGLWAPGPLTE